MSRGIWYFIGMSLVWLFKEINQVNLGAKAQHCIFILKIFLEATVK